MFLLRLLAILLLIPSLAHAEDNKSSFTITFSPIPNEEFLVGKWVFSEAWSMHMGLALELHKDHTFTYWFISDVMIDEKYPIQGTWELIKGTLQLSAPGKHLYSNNWVLARYNGKQGLLNPENIQVLIWHKSAPDTRFIRKLPSKPWRWPIYNYPTTMEVD